MTDPCSRDQQRMALQTIGTVRSPLLHTDAAPKQGNEGAPDAVIHIDHAFTEGLVGLAAGDQIVLITWLHKASRGILAVHPRDDPARPMAGVFATRSQDRPNPLGLHTVTVRELDGNRLIVGPLEAIDGTRVIDIKIAL